MKVKEMPEVGFTTRTGRRIYGQDEYDRDRKIVMLVTVLAIAFALAVAIGREL